MSTGGSLHQGGVEDANHMAGLLEQIKKCVSVLNFNSFKDGFIVNSNTFLTKLSYKRTISLCFLIYKR